MLLEEVTSGRGFSGLALEDVLVIHIDEFILMFIEVLLFNTNKEGGRD